MQESVSPAATGSAGLAASTFCAGQHRADECDSRGLPLTLNSTNIIGRFQALRTVQHPHLCAYLDISSARNERLIVVSEWHEDCLENHVKSGRYGSSQAVSRLARQLLLALDHLHSQGITHRGISPGNVLLTVEGDVKLHNYGLYYMTNNGRYVVFPIGSPRYMAPEVIASSPTSTVPSSAKVDIWSVGVLLLELFMETPVYPDLFVRNALGTLFKRIVLLLQKYTTKSVHPLSALLDAHKCDKPMGEELRSFLEACLTPMPSKRPTACELLSHPFLAQTDREPSTKSDYQFLAGAFSSIQRSASLQIPAPRQQFPGGVVNTLELDHLTERSLAEVYYLWSLAGGELEVEMRRQGFIQSRPPICSLPCLVSHEGLPYGLPNDGVTLYDSSVMLLSLQQLRERLAGMTTEDYYPVLESVDSASDAKQQQQQQQLSPRPHESSKLPLAIKERDIEYQFHRVVRFSRLLESYPLSQPLLVSEALTDVCPLLRGQVWASLLEVKGDIHWQYRNIDKESETSTDRQIEVDIPRCHQYDKLLSSKDGHRKFKRVLKAWVVSHPRLVYWQGLDSLCAPFLSLNFNNEALAYSCLSAFISKYLHKFFLKDNSPVMQEYLSVFSHMIAFHDTELYNHLDSISFVPELYAIPWFLTMFTHILPLHKIYHMWDTLLLGNCSFPMAVGVAILKQLKAELLASDFNECILMFSDLPDIDIQMCINAAVRVFQATPPSICVRQYEHILSQHDDIPPAARRQPLPLSTLKSESCPQISAHDVITLCRLETSALHYGNKPIRDSPSRGGANPLLTRGGKRARQKAIVVDIRSQEEFRLGHVPGSINIPQSLGFQADGSLPPTQASATLTSLRGRLVIVVASKGEAGPVFARQLLWLNFPKVCVLHGGAGILRSLGLLSSLHDDS